MSGKRHRRKAFWAEGIFLVLSVATLYVWHARQQLPGLSDLQVHSSKNATVLQADNPMCETAMQAHMDDYTRPIFVLTAQTAAGKDSHIQVRDVNVPWNEIPELLEGFFKTRAERTLFVLKGADVRPQLVDRMVSVARQSPFVDRVCMVDSGSIPSWFPRTPEPRGKL